MSYAAGALPAEELRSGTRALRRPGGLPAGSGAPSSSSPGQVLRPPSRRAAQAAREPLVAPMATAGNIELPLASPPPKGNRAR
eukprot:594688-Heterocapsa_arctica.AAC.1